MVFNLSLTPAEIPHEIAAGHARVVGKAVVDGVQTVELAISGFDGPGSPGDIWVDASSHLPVRAAVSAPTGMVQGRLPIPASDARESGQAPPGHPGGFTQNPALDGPSTSNRS